MFFFRLAAVVSVLGGGKTHGRPPTQYAGLQCQKPVSPDSYLVKYRKHILPFGLAQQ